MYRGLFCLPHLLTTRETLNCPTGGKVRAPSQKRVRSRKFAWFRNRGTVGGLTPAYQSAPDSYALAPNPYGFAPDSYGLSPDPYRVAPNLHGFASDSYRLSPDLYESAPDSYGLSPNPYGIALDLYGSAPVLYESASDLTDSDGNGKKKGQKRRICRNDANTFRVIIL